MVDERKREPKSSIVSAFTMIRFSLRNLMVVTAVVALLFGLPIRRAITQKRGRDWVASERGHVTFTHKYDDATATYDHEAELFAPDWLVSLIGIDFFDSVDHVTLDCYEVDDLEPITDLRELRSLAIIIEIKDNLDFSPLAKLPRLEELYLDYTDISAERLTVLREMLPSVQVVATNHPPVRDGE